VVGSGPFRFLSEEHISGAKAAFARFEQYRPRVSGAPGFTSGPKAAYFDRVEFLTLDGFSAQAALSNGEIDWWEAPSRDLADLVARDRNVTLISHYMPAMAILRFNVRQAGGAPGLAQRCRPGGDDGCNGGHRPGQLARRQRHIFDWDAARQRRRDRHPAEAP
jgi:hypothetical protein